MTNESDTGDLIATLRITGHGDHQMRGPVTIGRDPHADEGATVEVDGDALVSKSHLSIDIDQGDLIITDLGSSNGTYLHHEGGETVVPSDRWIPVPEGAEVEFGDQRMTFERPTPTVDTETGGDEDAQAVHEDAPTIDVAAGAADRPDPAPVASPAPTSGDECAQCHRPSPPGSRFCDTCGAPVASEADEAATPDDPAPIVDDSAHTVVVPPGSFGLAGAGGPGLPPGPPAPQYGAPPQYNGPPPQGPPPGPPTQPAGFHAQPPPPTAAPGQPQPPAGGPVFVDPNASTSTSGGAGKKIVMAVVVLVVLGLIGFGLVSVLGGDDDSSVAGGELTSSPTELDEQWSSGVDGEFGFPGVGESAVYVSSTADTDTLVTSLSRENGEENWQVTIDDADSGSLVGEFGEVAVVNACEFEETTSCAVVGLDIDDGDEIWRESIGDGTAYESSGNLIADDGEGLSLLDPATGDRMERVLGTQTLGDFGSRLLTDDGDVSVYSDDLQTLFGPVEIDDESIAATYDGSRLLVAVDDRIDYVDDSGDVTDGPRLDGDITRLIAVDASTVVAELGDEVVVYDLDGDDAVERWSQSGTVRAVDAPDGGDVAVIEIGGETVVVDLASGDERFDVDGDVEGGTFSIVTSNALVIYDGDFDEPVTITAYDWTTGDEIWSDEFDGSVLVDEILVVVETDGDVVAYG